MRIEHLALTMPDPVAAARWYRDHLGMAIVREQRESPFTHFLADSRDPGQRVLLEFYNNPATAPLDYARLHPLRLHLGFEVEDVSAARTRLLAAGATAEGEIGVTPAGDRLAMLRDPWGLAIQLAQRQSPLTR